MFVFSQDKNRSCIPLTTQSVSSSWATNSPNSPNFSKNSPKMEGFFAHNISTVSKKPKFNTGSGKKESKLDTLLASLDIINVPGDGSCLFWATALAYLSSISEDQLEEACVKLFGDKWNISLVKKMMQDTKLSKLPTTQQASSLIYSFRQQVVKYMFKTLSSYTFIEGVPLNTYLERMRSPIEWGGREEVQAISGLLDCKISVINSWDKNLEYIERFGTGSANSTHLFLFLANKHYYFGLQKGIQERSEKSSPSLAPTDQALEHKESNSNSKQANSINNLEGIAWAVKLRSALNKRSNSPISKKNKEPAVNSEKPIDLTSPSLQKSVSKSVSEKKQKSIENILRVYIEQIKQLRQLEVAELIEELSVLEEIEKLEEETEKNNEINILAPFQLLHPLNFITPLSRLRKFTRLKATKLSELRVLKEERIKKLKEMRKRNKCIALLRKLIEQKIKEMFSIQEKIKQPKELAEIEDQITKLDDKIAFQREWIGQKKPHFSDDSFNETSLQKNFLYLQQKWKERDERVRYFAELPFTAGYPDEASEVTGLLNKSFNLVSFCLEQTSEHINTIIINKVAPTINPYSKQLAKKTILFEQWFFKTFCLGGKFPGKEFSVEVT